MSQLAPDTIQDLENRRKQALSSLLMPSIPNKPANETVSLDPVTQQFEDVLKLKQTFTG